MFSGFSGALSDSRSYNLCKTFPNLVFIETIFALETVGLIIAVSGELVLNELTGLRCDPQMVKAALSRSFTWVSASSSETGSLPMVSSWMCLVNAFSPPNFRADQIADCYADCFCSVWVETFVDKLVQSFYIRFRKIQSD